MAILLESVIERVPLLVEGDAGVGKSAVLGSLADRLAGMHREVARVFGAAGADSLPLTPFSHLLTGWKPSDPPGQAAIELIRSIEHRATTSGLVLLVDDVQHLDQVSLTVVHQLVVQGSVSVVMTRRTGDPLPGLIDDLRRSGRVGVHRLVPLTREATMALVVQLAGAPPDVPTAARIWSSTRGNPLFVGELIADGVEHGHLDNSAGLLRWLVSDPTIDLRRTVRQRLDSVSAEEMSVMRIVALFGSVAAGPVRTGRFRDPLERLLDRGLLAVQRRGRREVIVAGHPLYAEAVRELLDDWDTVPWDDYLTLLETVPGRRTDDLLQRAVASLRSSRPPVVDDLLAGAGLALAGSAMELVIELAAAAQAIEPTTTGSVLLGSAYFGRGEPDRAQTEFLSILDLAGDIDEASLADVAVVWAINTFFGAGDIVGAERIHERFRQRIVSRWHHQLDVIQTILDCYTGHPVRAAQRLERILADDEVPEAARLWHTFPGVVAMCWTGRIRQAVEAMDRATGLAARHRALVVGTDAQLTVLGHLAAVCNGGAAERTARLITEFDAATERHDTVTAGIFAPFLMFNAWLTGDVAHVEIAERETVWTFGSGSWIPFKAYFAIAAYARAGLVEQAVQRASDAERLTVFATAEVARLVGLAELDLAIGRTAAAIGGFEAALASATGRGESFYSLLLAMRLAGIVDTDTAWARAQLEAQRVDSALAEEVAAAIESLAAGEFSAVLAAARSLGRGYAALAADLAGAVASRTNGEMRQQAGELQAQLQPRRPVVAPIRPLFSPAQQRVAELLASGRSNKEIATSLHLSIKTVEFHATSIFRALGVSRRAEAVRLLTSSNGQG